MSKSCVQLVPKYVSVKITDIIMKKQYCYILYAIIIIIIIIVNDQ